MTEENSISRKYYVPPVYSYYIQKATNKALKAVEEDEKKNYKEAIKHYEFSVEFLCRAMKNGEVQSKEKEEMVHRKCEEYLNRAEKIKSYLYSNSNVQ